MAKDGEGGEERSEGEEVDGVGAEEAGSGNDGGPVMGATMENGFLDDLALEEIEGLGGGAHLLDGGEEGAVELRELAFDIDGHRAWGRWGRRQATGDDDRQNGAEDGGGGEGEWGTPAEGLLEEPGEGGEDGGGGPANGQMRPTAEAATSAEGGGKSGSQGRFDHGRASEG